MAFTTGSRGAMVTVVIVAIALAVVRPGLEGPRGRHPRTGVAAVVLIASLLASVYVLEHDWSTSTVSLDDRPLLWQVASEYRHDAPVFGYGPDKWETLFSSTGQIPRSAQHSTHNQWVDVVFTAGWVGAALLAAMIIAVIWSAGAARAAVLLVLATVFLIGIGERAWFIGRADFASFSLIAVLLVGPVRVRTRPAVAVPAELIKRSPVAVPSG
jgi:O-antigen ligase